MNTLIQKSDLLNIIDYEKQRDTYRSELIDYKKIDDLNLVQIF